MTLLSREQDTSKSALIHSRANTQSVCPRSSFLGLRLDPCMIMMSSGFWPPVAIIPTSDIAMLWMPQLLIPRSSVMYDGRQKELEPDGKGEGGRGAGAGEEEEKEETEELELEVCNLGVKDFEDENEEEEEEENLPVVNHIPNHQLVVFGSCKDAIGIQPQRRENLVASAEFQSVGNGSMPCAQLIPVDTTQFSLTKNMRDSPGNCLLDLSTADKQTLVPVFDKMMH
eukprot:272613-Hanusia_phi.AAC.1